MYQKALPIFNLSATLFCSTRYLCRRLLEDPLCRSVQLHLPSIKCLCRRLSMSRMKTYLPGSILGRALTQSVASEERGKNLGNNRGRSLSTRIRKSRVSRQLLLFPGLLLKSSPRRFRAIHDWAHCGLHWDCRRTSMMTWIGTTVVH